MVGLGGLGGLLLLSLTIAFYASTWKGRESLGRPPCLGFPCIPGRAGGARTEPYHQIEIKVNVTMWDAANKSISLTNWS